MMNELLDNYSPTYEALSMIYGTMESDTETFKSFIHTGVLMESGMSTDIVMESVGDIFKSIVDGIKRLITKIKEFFKKILLYITSAHQDLDKVAAEVKKVIGNKTISFTIDGYKFSVLDKPNPDMSEFQSIVNSYNSDMDAIENLKESEIKKEISKWLEEGHLDTLRGKVLGTNRDIPENEYLEEIRKYYRSDESSTSKIEVDRSYVDQIINHSKKLEDAKKASMKDRDKIIELLTKTETFFGRTVQTTYSGGTKKINVDRVDINDDKFSRSDRSVDASDNALKIASMYASYKSKQVNKIASMINLVMCEKVNALKDQITLERKILRTCLFGNTEEKKDNTVNENRVDYSIVMMKSVLESYRDYDEMNRVALLQEANFIVESINNGTVSELMEADLNKLSGKVKSGIIAAIEKITKYFRQKAIGDCNHYTPWIEDIRDGIEEKAKAKKSFTMTDFNNAKYSEMLNQIQTNMQRAYASTNYKDRSFATNMVKEFSDDKIFNDTIRGEYLVNYFRTGNANEKITKKTYTGSELASATKVMMDYIIKYGSTVSQPVEGLSKKLEEAQKAFKPVEESFDGSTFLSILGCSVCESDITLCKDYNRIFESVTESFSNILLEAGDTKIGGTPEGVGDAGKANTQATKAAKPETQSASDAEGSVTKVESEDDPNAPGNEENKKKASAEATEYKKVVDNFFKQCISLYLKAREEQFIGYVYALIDIDGEPPKFDKNGKYITKEERKAKNKEAVGVESK